MYRQLLAYSSLFFFPYLLVSITAFVWKWGQLYQTDLSSQLMYTLQFTVWLTVETLRLYIFIFRLKPIDDSLETSVALAKNTVIDDQDYTLSDSISLYIMGVFPQCIIQPYMIYLSSQGIAQGNYLPLEGPIHLTYFLLFTFPQVIFGYFDVKSRISLQNFQHRMIIQRIEAFRNQLLGINKIHPSL